MNVVYDVVIPVAVVALALMSIAIFVMLYRRSRNGPGRMSPAEGAAHIKAVEEMTEAAMKAQADRFRESQALMEEMLQLRGAYQSDQQHIRRQQNYIQQLEQEMFNTEQKIDELIEKFQEVIEKDRQALEEQKKIVAEMKALKDGLNKITSNASGDA